MLVLLGAVVMVGIAVCLIVADVHIYRTRQKLISQVENLKTKIHDLKDKNNNLKQGIANADNSQYVEKIAREELDLQKPGEKVVSFVVTDKQSPQDASEQESFLQIWQANLGHFWSWMTGQLFGNNSTTN